VLPLLKSLKGQALDLFFPQHCLGCGKEGALICPQCLRSLPELSGPLCPKCGKPQPGGILCQDCIDRRHSIDGIRSPLKFEGLAREAVHQFKYRNLRSLAGQLATILHEFLLANPVPFDCIIPVPLHAKRLRERGYNQSALLARELNKHLNLPVITSCLIRKHYVLSQARTKSAWERRQNVKDAFECLDNRIRERQVLLIDDVATSGSTLDACAKSLKSKGAKSVWGLVLAREI